MQNLIRAIAILGLCTLMIVMRTAVGAESGSGAGAVTAERIARAGSDPEQWLTTGRDQAGSYYSPLADINRSNVGHLGFAWDYKLGTHRGVESTPLVVDGAMYVVGN